LQNNVTNMTDETNNKTDELKNDASQASAVDVNDEFDELKQKCEEYLNGWKRAQADYQNFVKETGKWRVEFVRFANENLVLGLLPIMDNFEAAFGLISESHREAPVAVGFAHIKKQLEDFLKENGVERMKTVGEKFDPLRHEAIEHRQVEGTEAGVIIEEKKAGYELNKKVVQAAKVIVAG